MIFERKFNSQFRFNLINRNKSLETNIVKELNPDLKNMSARLKMNFKKDLRLKVNGSLWIECGSKKYFGPGPMELLERIEITGSINKAAKQMGMSYKKSWDIINHLNKKVTRPLVETKIGGKKGGGSFISNEAKQLIAQYKDLRKKFELFLEKETKHFL